MSEGPKLYTNKPKKAQLKQFQEQVKGKDSSAPSSSSAAAASYTMRSQPTPPPPPPSPLPPPPKESFARRYKFLWPLLLGVNLAVGAYLFMRTKKKDTDITEEDAIKSVPSTPVSTTVVTPTPVTEKPLPTPSTAAPVIVKLPAPIPESQQRELFKWILEEKRKIKPTDPEAKKQLDEEKAVLKQFIRAKSIPSI